MKLYTKEKAIRHGLISALILTVIPTISQARDQIQIVGSSTVYPFSTLVAERFGGSGKFKTPVVESTGTGGGMKLFCQGVGASHPDVSNASRAIKSSELENCRKNGVKDIIEVSFGNDGIAFANAIDARPVNFTRKQLWAAMAEHGPKPAKWSDIDKSLPDTKISILVPPPTSGTRDAWNAKVMKGGCPAELKKKDKKACAIMREDGPVVEAGENDALIVQKLEANHDSFGIFGFSYLENNSDKIQAATIEGVEISLESIQSYEYPIARPLFFYVKKAHIGVIPGLNEYLQAFVEEKAIGDDGYLIDAGLVPLDDGQRISLRKNTKDLAVLNKQ
ncbi:MAG: substrate-binding domain-containing protein [Gammaproteobacteria bacterium]|nr:substrate-binding domain-containing protein [Gammaproteobacteria bacterium]MCW8924572.1 substrate-binding domain-containing protein [Gammaproteobacteria bacterium]